MKNCILHAIYYMFYFPVKYLAFPFSDYLRLGVLCLFSRTLRSRYIADGVTIYFPWNVKADKTASLNQGIIIDGFGGVEIGRGVRIAAYTCINTADHDFADHNTMIYQSGYRCAKVIIEDDVWIGNHVCINKGVRIGKGSVIGAGAVVTKDIPDYSVAAGVPARVIRSRWPLDPEA